MKNLVNYSARFGIPFIAITSSASSPLGQAADIVLELPKAREACPHNLAPTTSALMQLAIGDALAIALLEGRGFTAIDFKMRHPGGKLGAMLRQVREFMHTGDAIPLKALGTTMKQAVAEITAKGFGCVGITDKSGALVGIITDGDLRRHLGNDLTKARVDDIMTRKPRTIPPDMLASEAVAILNGNSPKVTVLLVTQGTKPVGIVHVHDFLQAGVV
jgi:arabinose-5-phosphate isomerase